MDRADQMRRQIEEYRRQLAEGVKSERAVEYLHQIKWLQNELAEIEGEGEECE